MPGKQILPKQNNLVAHLHHLYFIRLIHCLSNHSVGEAVDNWSAPKYNFMQHTIVLSGSQKFTRCIEDLYHIEKDVISFSTQEVENIWRKQWKGNMFFSHGRSHSRGLLLPVRDNLDFHYDLSRLILKVAMFS